MPAVTEQSAKAMVRTTGRLMPARRAASGLPPIAYMERPNFVRSSRMVQAPRMTRTIGTTHGTPARTPKLARLMFEMATRTIPAIAITAILSTVRLGGGATSPLLRRR